MSSKICASQVLLDNSGCVLESSHFAIKLGIGCLIYYIKDHQVPVAMGHWLQLHNNIKKGIETPNSSHGYFYFLFFHMYHQSAEGIEFALGQLFLILFGATKVSFGGCRLVSTLNKPERDQIPVGETRGCNGMWWRSLLESSSLVGLVIYSNLILNCSATICL